jgi:hypothetical protein
MKRNTFNKRVKPNNNNVFQNRRIRRNNRRFPRRKRLLNVNRRRQQEKNQNKKINDLQQKMKNLQINERKLGVTNLNPYFNKVKLYIDALLNPEKFINSGIKIPNPLTTYSFSYGFKEQFTITPNEEGNFTLIWFPNLFSCVDLELGNNISRGGTYARIANVGYTFTAVRRFCYTLDANNRTWNYPSTHIMQTPMEGYRLVSASILIKYIGKVINKSGYIISAPTYRNYGTWASTTTKNYPFSIISTDYPTYDETILNNTRGSVTKNILNDNYVKRLYVPLDSFDTAFEDPGFYYSITTSAQKNETLTAEEALLSTRYKQPQISGSDSWIRYLAPEEGNPLKYVFVGKGFTNNQPESIMVMAYYNFECIPVEGVVVPNNNNNPNYNNEYNLRTATREEIFNEMKNVVNEDPLKVNKNKIAKRIKN